jgi:hypothetical protein
MATSEIPPIELITIWDGSWVETLNNEVTPLLKDIYFAHHCETFNIEGKIHTGQDLVKVVIDANSKDFFLDSLKEGELDKGRLLAVLEGFIRRDFEFQLCRHVSYENTL